MKKRCQRRLLRCLLFFGGCMLLAACGKKEPQPPSFTEEGELSFFTATGGEGIELRVERSGLYDAAPELQGQYDMMEMDDGKSLGLQFYQGEPVQLWRSALSSDTARVDVYMYHQDGTRDICLERVDSSVGEKIAFMDSQGCCYRVDSNMNNDRITKLDSTGAALYSVKMEGDRGSIKSICELADGRLAVLVGKRLGALDYGIILLDDKGESTIVELSEQLPGDSCYMGTSDDGLLLMMQDQLYRVGLPDGKLEPIFSFVQTAYSASGVQNIAAFYLRGDGKLEVLRKNQQGVGVHELLSLERRNEDKQDVILRGLHVKNYSDVKELVFQFNNSNDKYRVVIEGPEESDDYNDYITRTGVELATGKGPDILMGDSLLESPAALIEKGGLLDLAPLMERAGIREEDYYPLAFDTWRTGDSIYSIRFFGDRSQQLMLTAVLGDADPSDIGAVVDALLAYPENATYCSHYSASDILEDLLKGSETLWGMVDWEKGTCDFSGELFGKLLEVAKRYQYDARYNYPAVCTGRIIANIYTIYQFSTSEQLQAEGKMVVGPLFDDGLHAVCFFTEKSFSINANAKNKEGAWEFLQFLLSDEVQDKAVEEFGWLPVKRNAYWAAVEEEMQNGPSENYKWISKDHPLTREKAEEVEALLEDGRELPYKTEIILEIVLEETQAYFKEGRDIRQVIDKIENRVGLYLKERQ